VPDLCQNGQRLRVHRGHSRPLPTLATLAISTPEPTLKRSSKQRVAGSSPARRAPRNQTFRPGRNVCARSCGLIVMTPACGSVPVACPFAVVPHPVHQLPQRRARGGRQGVAGMPQNLLPVISGEPKEVPQVQTQIDNWQRVGLINVTTLSTTRANMCTTGYRRARSTCGWQKI
jgi:hypothetical protein